VAIEKSASLLGVGGVGKTTFVYRLLGLSLRPRVTLRPGVYRMFLGDREINLIDVPGQMATEVAKNFARMWTFNVDLMIYMYDLTDHQTLHAIAEIHSALLDRGFRPYRNAILIGNKRDLAEECGIFIEGDEIASAIDAKRIYYISAQKDEIKKLVKIIEENI